MALVTGTGYAGTSNANLLTQAGTLTANVGGNVYVTNNGAVNLGASTVGGILQLNANNNITGTGTVLAGNLYLTTTANNGNIVIASNVTGTGVDYLTTQGTGTVSVNAGYTAASTNSITYITAYDLNILGNIDSHNNATFLRPNQNEAIAVADTSSSAPFQVTSAELGQITAAVLAIGDINKTGGITVDGNINVSGSGAGAYGLVFWTAGNYVATGQTITLGTTTSLTVNAQGNVNTGTVTVAILPASQPEIP